MGVIHNLNDKTRLNPLFASVAGIEPDEMLTATITMLVNPGDPTVTEITPSVATVIYVDYLAGEDFQLFNKNQW